MMVGGIITYLLFLPYAIYTIGPMLKPGATGESSEITARSVNAKYVSNQVMFLRSVFPQP